MSSDWYSAPGSEERNPARKVSKLYSSMGAPGPGSSREPRRICSEATVEDEPERAHLSDTANHTTYYLNSQDSCDRVPAG